MLRKLPIATQWATLSLLVGAPGASAVIVNGSDGTQNTTAPAGLSYWNNLGFLPSGSDTGGSGVYLGNGWVLTAYHAHGGRPNAFPFVIPKLNNGQDATFTADPGNYAVLRLNPTAALSDVALFRLQDNPLLHNLPTVQFGATPQVGTNVTIVGSSWNRAPALHHWLLADPSQPSKTTWTDVTGQLNQSSANRHGYLYDPSLGFAKRWATNTTVAVSGTSPTLLFEPEDGNGNVVRSTTLFGAVFNNLPNEGQVANGDSGGGVFAGNRLVGINLLKGDDVKDPNNPANVGQPEQTAVYGNGSYFANLADFVNQIATVTGLHPSVDGDANLDGRVNGADFALLLANFGSEKGWMEGDFNLNGHVDFADYQILERNFGFGGATAPGVTVPALSTVPEPGVLTWFGAVAFAALVRRRRTGEIPAGKPVC